MKIIKTICSYIFRTCLDNLSGQYIDACIVVRPYYHAYKPDYEDKDNTIAKLLVRNKDRELNCAYRLVQVGLDKTFPVIFIEYLKSSIYYGRYEQLIIQTNIP